jgi:homoserine kinase type II
MQPSLQRKTDSLPSGRSQRQSRGGGGRRRNARRHFRFARRIDRRDRREETVHAHLERSFLHKEPDNPHQAQCSGLAEIDLAFDEGLEGRETLGLVKPAGLNVLEHDADVVERLWQALPKGLDLRESRMEISHLLLDILGVFRGADRGASAPGQGRLGSPGARFGSVLGGVSRGPRRCATKAKLAFGGPRLVLALRAGLGRHRLPSRRRPHRRARLGGVDRLRDRLFRLGHMALGSGQSSGITAASHPSPPKSARYLPGGDSDETPCAHYQSPEARVYTGNAQQPGAGGRGSIPSADMAVLTPVTEDDARDLLAAHGLGAFVRLTGIAGGSVNSNFVLEATGSRVFLRLYEERDLAGARLETAMLERLASAGVPTPAPLRRLDGELVSIVRGKPAALFPWRDGHMRCQVAVTSVEARRVGEALARVHVAGAAEVCDAGRFQFPDLIRRLDRIAASADEPFRRLVPGLRTRLEQADAVRDRALPSGLIHGDLFRDNVLWDAQGEITALLDFESACHGTYAYDLMVTVLSWCVGDDLDSGLAGAMRAGYELVRPLSDQEKRGLHAEACFAALRFTLTRITDYAMRTDSEGPRVVKDWRRFLKRFEILQTLGSEGLSRALQC